MTAFLTILAVICGGYLLAAGLAAWIEGREER